MTPNQRMSKDQRQASSRPARFVRPRTFLTRHWPSFIGQLCLFDPWSLVSRHCSASRVYQRARIAYTSLKRQQRIFAGASGLCSKIVHAYFVFASLLCVLLSGCSALTNPVANGVPVRRLPPELLGEPKEGARSFPLTLLRQSP